MSRQPIPLPTDGDLRRWAARMSTYLRALEASLASGEPRIIQLEHMRTSAKASTDGLLMFDGVAGVPMYSRNGAWRGLYGGAGVPAQDNTVSTAVPHYDVDASKLNNMLIVGRGVALDTALTRVMDFETETEDFAVATHIGLDSAGVETSSTGAIPLNNEATTAARSFSALVFNMRGTEAQVFVPARSANYLLLGPIKTVRIRPNGTANITAGTIRCIPI